MFNLLLYSVSIGLVMWGFYSALQIIFASKGFNDLPDATQKAIRELSYVLFFAIVCVGASSFQLGRYVEKRAAIKQMKEHLEEIQRVREGFEEIKADYIQDRKES